MNTEDSDLFAFFLESSVFAILKKSTARLRIANKRGVFFTILAIVIISLFALSYSFFSDTGKRENVQKRVETLNNFVFSIEEDISRQLFVSGFRTIFLVEDEILQSEKNISNLSLVFNESFFDGTYKGVDQEIMEGATFDDMLINLQNLSEKVNANVVINGAVVEVKQDDPWNVKFSMKFNLVVEDVSSYVRWDKESVIEAYVPIKYFNNPLFLKNPEIKDKVSSKMIPSPFSAFVSGSDISNLSSYVDNSYYTNNTGAPSFIDRLEGRFTGNINGVEGIIHAQRLSNFTTIAPGRSLRDFVYFSSGGNQGIVCRISGLPNWVLIENSSIYDVYGAGGHENCN